MSRLSRILTALVVGVSVLRALRPSRERADGRGAPPPGPAATAAPPATRARRARIARRLIAARWWVVGLWVGILIACTLLLPTIREAQVGALGDLVPRHAEALQAEQRSAELFGFPLLSRTIVVQRSPAGLDSEAQRRAFENAAGLLTDRWPRLRSVWGAAPISNAIGAPFSREDGTTIISFLGFRPDLGQVGRNGLAHLFVDQHLGPEDAPVGVTGAIPARAEQAAAISSALPRVELATVALVAFALAGFFRAIGPPLLGLGAVALAYLVAIRAIAGVGELVGVSVPSEVEPVIVVLLFGVLTDYTIFYVSRYRRRLREGVPAREAAIRATSEMTPTVFAAAMAVIAAGAALGFARLGFLQAFGPGVSVSVAVGMAVAITFVPCAMAIAGPRLFWPSRPDRKVPATVGDVDDASRPVAGPRGRRAVRIAVAHPAITCLTCVTLLLALAFGLTRMHPGNGLIRGLPSGSEPVVAYHAASKGFVPGILSPTVVVVEQPGITRRRDELAALQRRLTAAPGVSFVAGPANNPLPEALGATLSSTGDAARFVVVFNSDPLGARAIKRLGRLRARLPAILADSGLPAATATIAGDTALAEETVDGTLGDGLRVLPVLLIALYVVLAVFLRALIAPLLMLTASMLVVAASLGLGVYVIQDWRYGEVTYYVPFAAAVLLVSLGSDYTMFLAGRVWEAARRQPLREAIVDGGSRAATSIAVAGGLLAASFALLALVPLRAFRELAFIMSTGLLLDAFLVRPLLLPALLAWVGERSAWPTRLGLRGRHGPHADQAAAPVPEPRPMNVR